MTHPDIPTTPQRVTCRLETPGGTPEVTWAVVTEQAGIVRVDTDAGTETLALTAYEARCLADFLEFAVAAAEAREAAPIPADACECARCPAHPERGPVTQQAPCRTCQGGGHLRFLRCPHRRVLAHCADPGCRAVAARLDAPDQIIRHMF